MAQHNIKIEDSGCLSFMLWLIAMAIIGVGMSIGRLAEAVGALAK